MSAGYCVLVVAKAPVPGLAKTRLCPPATPAEAAEIAAAALLDTLDTVLSTSDTKTVVAITGDLANAARGTELRAKLRHTTVIAQRGPDLARRLVNAHADTARLHTGSPVVQIGMDTPQVTAMALDAVAREFARHDAVLGPAQDGGWWALGLRDPARAAALADVPMSRPDTGKLTRHALESAGLRTTNAGTLSDVDRFADAIDVASSLPRSRFARAVHAVAARAGTP